MPMPMQGAPFAEGMNLSVTCREMAPFTSRDAIAQANANLPPVLRAHYASPAPIDTCDLWNVTPAPALEHMPVMSDRPSLVLSGEYDPVTPPAWGKAAASTLTHSTFVEIPAEAHGTFVDPCALGIVERFFLDPSVAPDTSCVQSIPPLVFVTAQHAAPSPDRVASVLERLPPQVLAELRRRLRAGTL
jgi:pimeloyl-ACP methyl ester carboxylesterase